MKKRKTLKILKLKYNTIIIFIFSIIFLIICCLAGAWYLYDKNEFGYSTLLNIFGGLFTGLILLSYQHLSNKHLRETNEIIEKLEYLDEIDICETNELDFCTDNTYPTEEQMENHGIEVQTILKDNEGVFYALSIYEAKIKKVEEQLNAIKDFSINTLDMDLGIASYEEALEQVKQYFSAYSKDVHYVQPPYMIYKNTWDNFENEEQGNAAEVFNTEEEMNKYLEEHPDILSNNLYCKSSPTNLYEKRVVYKDNEEVEMEDVYKEWMKKVNDLVEVTQGFNELLKKNKSKVLRLHNKKSNIIH